MMAYIINNDDKDSINPFLFEQGKNSYFAKVNIDGRKHLLKFFNVTDEEILEEKVNTIKHFKKMKYDDFNAFPIDTISVNGCEKGYLSQYIENSVTFYEKEGYSLPYDLRYRAVLDNTEQLKFIHRNGFILNDVRLSNHMISVDDQRGFLVDFEDSILESDFKIKPTYYRFYRPSEYEMLPPSKNDDAKKQFICNLSILMQEDFESFVIARSEWSLLNRLAFNYEIYNFADALFRGNDILYFDQIAPAFSDEEKVLSYKRELSK